MNIATAKNSVKKLKANGTAVKLFKRGDWLWIAGATEDIEIPGFKWSSTSEAHYYKPSTFGVEIPC